jgi:uncharacterized protein (UPF0548 family)
MISLLRPDESEISGFLERAAASGMGSTAAFSHAEVGATADPEAVARLSGRYAIDHRRFVIGRGDALFDTARSALFAWRHFEIPWLELHGGGADVRTGRVVATLTRAFGLWFLNPCRVVYRKEDRSEGDRAKAGPRRASFAYGTLGGHVACGEERFSLEVDPRTKEVAFEILAFSRPSMVLTRLGRPWMRSIQRRFAVDAANALARACGAAAAAVEVESGRDGERFVAGSAGR